MLEVEIPWDETRAFVEDLTRGGARFIVDGSVALRFHVPAAPEWQFARDLDVLLEPSAQMHGELNGALLRAGAQPTEATVEQFIKGNCGFSSKRVLNIDFRVPTPAEFSRFWADAAAVGIARSTARTQVASITTLEHFYGRALNVPDRAERAAKALEALARARRDTA
ncbi:MAG TPA: hypothetical protein VMH40_09290 [Myxococcaceae bacterium]|nr:hypothetical protein [Anaeromyxobacteraceae bacterium]HTS80778.1 hypothetical protein [Myxococcaceae bacterium]